MLPGRKYTLDDIARILWKRKLLMAGTFLACVFAGLCLARMQPDLYRSETLVQVLPQRVPDALVRPTVTSTVEERLKTITGVLRSHTYLQEIIEEMHLYPVERQTKSIDQVVEDMRDDIAVEIGAVAGARRMPNEAVNAFRVSFVYADRPTALEVTRQLTAKLIDENTRMRGNLAEATNSFLQTQLTEARKNLELQEGKLESFRQRHAGSLPTQMDSNMQQVQAIQLQIQQVVESIARDRDSRLMLERMYEDAKAQLETVQRMPVPVAAQGGDQTLVLSARQRLATARAQLEALQQRLTPEHPDVVRAMRQVKELEAAAAQEGEPNSTDAGSGRSASADELSRRAAITERKAQIDSLGRQVAFKEQEERRLRAQLAQFQSRIESVPGIESEYIRLSRDYDTLNETYKSLLAKSEDSKVSANLERRQIGEQFRVLDAPRVSDTPVSLNRLKINMGGIAGGVILALLLVGLLEFFDTTFRTDADILNALSLPVLATVPLVPTPADTARAARKTRLVAATWAVSMVLSGVAFWQLQLWKYVV